MRRRPVGWLFAALFAIAGAGALGSLLGGGDPYVVRAEFADLGGVRENSDVKIGGVPVGEVAAVAVSERDTAVATLELDVSAGEIGAGASARSRPASVFGDKYIDLRPGDLDRPLPSGSMIPRSRTSTAVELDDVLNTLTPDVRARLQTLIHESGRALVGRGEDLRALLFELPPTLREARELVAQLTRDNDRLRGLIVRGDRVLSAVTPNRDALADLVSTASRALENVAERRTELGQTIEVAPGALRRLQGTLAQLTDTAGELRVASGEIRRASPWLSELLRELPSFTAVASPALSALNDSAPTLRALGDQGGGHIRRLRTTTSILRDFGESSRPATESLERRHADLLGVIEGWSRAIQNRDGLGHYFHGQAIIHRDLADALVAAYVRPAESDAGTRRARRNGRDRQAGEGEQRPQGEGRASEPESAERVPPAPEGLRLPEAGPLQAPDGSDPAGDAPQRMPDELLDFLLGP